MRRRVLLVVGVAFIAAATVTVVIGVALGASSADLSPQGEASAPFLITPALVQYGGNTFPCANYTNKGAVASFQINNPRNGPFTVPGVGVVTLSDVTKTTVTWSSDFPVYDLGVNGGSFTAWYSYETPRTAYNSAPGKSNGVTYPSEGVLTAAGGVQGDRNVHATIKSGTVLYNLSYMTFCFMPPSAVLSGTVYKDLNGNGSQEGATEGGLSGRTVRLYAGSNPPVTGATDSNGFFNLGSQPLGTTYKVCLKSVSTTYRQTQPGSGGQCSANDEQPNGYSFTLSAGRSDLNFGEAPNGSIAVKVFEDKNADGTFNGTDAVQSQRTVCIDNTGNSACDANTADVIGQTDATGASTFSLTPKTTTYRVCQTLDGWLSSPSPSAGTCTDVTVVGEQASNVNFGIYKNATISGSVYWDKAGDGGPFSAGTDPPLAGWTVCIDNTGNSACDANTADVIGQTDAAGAFTFPVTPGTTYKVCEALPTPWINSDPSDASKCKTTSLLLSQSTTSVSLGNYYTVALGGSVLKDLNGNGLATDAGDGGVGGFRVSLYRGTAPLLSLVDSVASAVDTGAYGFTGVKAGLSYTICVSNSPNNNSQAATISGNWTEKVPAPPLTSNCSALTEFAGGRLSSPIVDVNHGDFLLQPVFAISGTVFNDVNADGKKSGEAGLSGRTVTLYDGSASPPTRTTGSGGSYSFDAVPTGTYKVCLGDPSGPLPTDAHWGETLPTAGDPHNQTKYPKTPESGPCTPASDFSQGYSLSALSADTTQRDFGIVQGKNACAKPFPFPNYIVRLAGGVCKDDQVFLTDYSDTGNKLAVVTPVRLDLDPIPMVERITWTIPSDQRQLTLVYDDTVPYGDADKQPMRHCLIDPRDHTTQPDDGLNLQQQYWAYDPNSPILPLPDDTPPRPETSCLLEVRADTNQYTFYVYSSIDGWRSTP